ncbi:MAG: S8 family serine peptidase [Pyrinomonadaceae bacterium]
MTRLTRFVSGSFRHLLSLTLSYALIVSLWSPLLLKRVDAAPDAAKKFRPPATVSLANQQQRRDGELIVRFREEATEQERNTLAAARGVRRAGALRGESRVERLELLAAGQNPEALAVALRAHPAVEFAEPNFLIRRDDVTPNDPRFGEQWALRNTGTGGGQVGADIRAGAAWERTTGTLATTIAVIDSGIDFTHPDLQNNQWINRRERDNNRDDDRNGMVDDLSGWDWINDSGGIRDEQGHGTRVAGIIAAQGDNGIGISGVMWRAGLMSLRVLDNTGTGNVADAVEAIDYAVAQGAHVINCSWGLDQESAILRDAIVRAGRRGVVVVCAAGNNGQNIDGSPYYPASFGLSNLITVAATDSFDQLTSWSNWGASRVTVGAPGVDLLTTQMGGDYTTMTGTSAAAPLVTGIAGLVKTVRPWLSAAGTVTAVVEGARQSAGLAGKVSSSGVANAAGTIRALRGTGFDYGSGNGSHQRPGNGQARPRPGNNPGRSEDYRGRAPDPTRGAPDADPARRNMPNLDEERRRTPDLPAAPASIRANDLGRCDSGCSGSFPPGSGTDPHFTVQRIEPVNQTGQDGVDLGSRNFNWSAQLLNLKGRADLDFTLSLAYNSLVWTKQSGRMRFNPARGFPGAGFRTGFPTLQPRYNQFEQIVAYLMVLPSGGQVELKRVILTGKYESFDGTYMQLTHEGGGAVVRTTDGTQMTFSPSVDDEMRCTQIKDRNGNYISITYNGLGRPTTVTDTLGRVVTFRYDANDYLVAIEQPWMGGVTHQWATFSYGSLPIQTNFRNTDGTPIPVEGPANGTSIPVLTKVGLGDGSSYEFSYNSWGQVHKITNKAADFYTNAYTRYSLPLNATNPESDCPRFREKYEWAYDWNNGAEAVTVYSVDPNNAWSQMTLPDGLTIHKEYFATSGWQKGLTTRTETIYSGVVRQWSAIEWTQDDTNLTYQRNPRPLVTETGDAEGNHLRTRYAYTPPNEFSLPREVTEYAVSGTTETVLRRTTTAYSFNPSYLDRRIIGLVLAREVRDGGGVLVSQTHYGYDYINEFLTATAQPPTQHDPAYGAGFAVRGNLSITRRFDANDPNNSSRWLDTLFGYHITGAQTFTVDPVGHQTRASYYDSFSDGTNRNTFAYPTVVTDGDNYSSTRQYRFDIGEVSREQNPKGAFQTTNYDAAGRIQQVTNGINGYYTRWSYPNSLLGVYTYSPSQYGSGEVFAGRFLDGAGRVRRTSVDHPNSSGGYSAQQVDYDVLGRVVRQSNPTESTGMWSAAGDDSAGGWRWTSQEYDWKDRPTRTTNTDNTTRETVYTGCGCAGGETQMWRDESGRWRRLINDPLGRLRQVDELTRDRSLYATTTYTYNGRDQVTQINQAGQIRTFEYDGHGRLSRRTTPEQGLTQYAYHNDDTVQAVTDARGAVISYGYNGRHLVTSINYAIPAGVAATNNVTFGYDEAGNRTSMTERDSANNVVGSATYNYDTLSRMNWEERTFGGLSGAFRISYGYNAAGNLTSVTNPWNVQVGYIHDRVGRLRGVSGANYAGVSFYAHNMDYRAFGAVKFMNYGSNSARTFSAAYDTRMRLTEWKVPDVMWWQYRYDKFGETTGRVTYAKNLYDATLNRSYEYDPWGRLQYSHTGAEADLHAGERAPGGPPLQPHEYGPYAHHYYYDVWGNITQRLGWGGANPSYTASFTNNRRAGSQYDPSGNITSDGGQAFTYDATGQQAWASFNNTQQAYDGDGLRVKRSENSAPTFYLRSTVLGGQVVAEVDQWGGWQRGYVYMGTQLLALQQYGGVEWVHQDLITKSQRLTNINGAVTSLVDLDPWGGETAASVSQFRQPQRYTTYLRDANGSDEAMMRRYNRWWSRFDQPDPYDGAYDLTNPQSLNRYAYVSNDPVNFIDPTGLFCVWISTTGRDSDGFLRTEWRLDCSFFYGGGGGRRGGGGGDDRGRGGGGRRTQETPTQKHSKLSPEQKRKVREAAFNACMKRKESERLQQINEIDEQFGRDATVACLIGGAIGAVSGALGGGVLGGVAGSAVAAALGFHSGCAAGISEELLQFSITQVRHLRQLRNVKMQRERATTECSKEADDIVSKL